MVGGSHYLANRSMSSMINHNKTRRPAPLSKHTQKLIGERELQLMKPTAFLINTGRGELVDEQALVRALLEKRVAGAALDVFEHEPLEPGSPLWHLPDVVITPHTSAFRDDYWTLAVDLFAQNLRRFERGEPLVNLVDKSAGY